MGALSIHDKDEALIPPKGIFRTHACFVGKSPQDFTAILGSRCFWWKISKSLNDEELSKFAVELEQK